MELLADRFNARGFEYNKIFAIDNFYVYSLTRNDMVIGYEVLKRMSSPVCLDFENRIYSETEKKETFPSSGEAGGKTVWFFRDKKNAINDANEKQCEVDQSRANPQS